MTKARARMRAKAKAATKSRKPKAPEGTEGPEGKTRPDRFDAKTNSMRNTSGANVNSPAAMKRGSARSR